MKNKFYNRIFKLVMIFIAKRLVHSNNRLTPEYLLSKGWVMQEGVGDRVIYTELGIKDRDRITIAFSGNGFIVWHSDKLTFIAAETTLEWFEIYWLIIHPDNGRYKLSGL